MTCTRPIRVLTTLLCATLLTACGASAGPDQSSAPTASTSPSSASAAAEDGANAALARLEAKFGARVGVSAVDTGDGRSVQYRQRDRFGFASTLKVFAAAEFLRTVPESERDTRVTWSEADVDAAGYAPVTSKHINDGMTLAQLAEAAVRQSDNAAMNLILDHIGGPAALDEALADLGDSTTHVVNREPELNTIEPGSIEDTTTPAAFTKDLRVLLESSVLREPDRTLLIEWMSGNTAGDTLIRAGAPEGWKVAQKSGGAGGLRSDIAIVTPPDASPVILTVMTAKRDAAEEYEDELLAEVARVVLARF